jgi:general secretion pathway protein J
MNILPLLIRGDVGIADRGDLCAVKSPSRLASTAPLLRGRSHKGFTLFEILIAVLILGIIGVLMVRGLNTMTMTKDRLAAHEKNTAELSLALSFLQSDFASAINRPILLPDKTLEPAFFSTGNQLYTVSFTRAGAVGRAQGELIRIDYFLQNGDLVRRTWPVLDRLSTTLPSDRILLSKVTNLSWRFLDANSNWQTSFGQNGFSSTMVPSIGMGTPAGTSQSNTALPILVDVSFTYQGMNIDKIIVVQRQLPAITLAKVNA